MVQTSRDIISKLHHVHSYMIFKRDSCFPQSRTDLQKLILTISNPSLQILLLKDITAESYNCSLIAFCLWDFFPCFVFSFCFFDIVVSCVSTFSPFLLFFFFMFLSKLMSLKIPIRSAFNIQALTLILTPCLSRIFKECQSIRSHGQFGHSKKVSSATNLSQFGHIKIISIAKIIRKLYVTPTTMLCTHRLDRDLSILIIAR